MALPIRQRRKEATREALKGAAVEVFTEHGYAETTIGAITSTAGVAHGTFYVHFSGKDEVLEEVLQELNTALALQVGEVWAAAAPAGLAEQVRRAAETFLDYWEERRGFAAAYAEKLAAGTRLTQLRDGVNPPMVGFISAQLRQADTGLPNLELATQALLALWVRVLLQYLFTERVGRGEAVETLVHMTLGAVRGVP